MAPLGTIYLALARGRRALVIEGPRAAAAFGWLEQCWTGRSMRSIPSAIWLPASRGASFCKAPGSALSGAGIGSPAPASAPLMRAVGRLRASDKLLHVRLAAGLQALARAMFWRRQPPSTLRMVCAGRFVPI